MSIFQNQIKVIVGMPAAFLCHQFPQAKNANHDPEMMSACLDRVDFFAVLL
jgi:hypothetical protein